MAKFKFDIYRWFIILIILGLWGCSFFFPLLEYEFGGIPNYIFWYGMELYDTEEIVTNIAMIIWTIVAWVAITIQIFTLYSIDQNPPKRILITSITSNIVLIVAFVFSILEHGIYLIFYPYQFSTGFYLSIITIIVSICITILLIFQIQKRKETKSKQESDKWAEEAVKRAIQGE